MVRLIAVNIKKGLASPKRLLANPPTLTDIVENPLLPASTAPFIEEDNL